jgi:hypothetical protein
VPVLVCGVAGTGARNGQGNTVQAAAQHHHLPVCGTFPPSFFPLDLWVIGNLSPTRCMGLTTSQIIPPPSAGLLPTVVHHRNLLLPLRRLTELLSFLTAGWPTPSRARYR